MYIWHRGPRRLAPTAVPQGVKSLTPWGMAAGAYFLRQVVHRGARTLPPSPSPWARRQGLFLVFDF
jgi:hypothetical protein